MKTVEYGRRIDKLIPSPIKRVANSVEEYRFGRLMTKLKANKERLPHDVLLVPDGNRRYAEEEGLEVIEGHKAGLKTIFYAVDVMQELDIYRIGGWALSSDNFGRDPEQLKNLFLIINGGVVQLKDRIEGEDVQVSHMGRTDRLPDYLKESLEQIQEATKNNTSRRMDLFIDYGWTDPLLEAFEGYRTDASRPKDVPLTHGDIVDLVDQHVSGPRFDLMIRTSGEQRTSGFGDLVNYSELVFIDKLLPKVSPFHIARAIEEYTNRKRRGGK